MSVSSVDMNVLSKLAIPIICKGKYLRMLTKNTIDADGSGKEDPSRWVIHEKDGYVLLESKKYEGKYLAVNKDAKKVVVGKGKKRSQLKLKRQ